MVNDIQELLDDFFSLSFESVITEEMFERNYVFPQSKVEDYLLSIISTPYQYFIDYVYTHYCAKTIMSADIPQISNYDYSTRGICSVMKNMGDPGLTYNELGAALSTDGDNKKEGALKKFGENHVKGAAFHGLTHASYTKWFLTCIGYIFPELDEEMRQYLSARTLLRNPFFHIIVSEAVEHDVNIIKYMRELSSSTQNRRSSSCMQFFNIIKNQCQLEKVPLYNIYYKNDYYREVLDNELLSVKESDESDLDYYLHALITIKRGSSRNGVVNAKPILLLTIIQSIENNNIKNNKILFDSNEFRDLYYSLYKKYEPDRILTSIEKPFFYLSHEPFYHLKWKDDSIDVDKPTKKTIQEQLDYAYLDDSLWVLLNNADFRDKARSIIEKKFFDI